VVGLPPCLPLPVVLEPSRGLGVDSLRNDGSSVARDRLLEWYLVGKLGCSSVSEANGAAACKHSEGNPTVEEIGISCGGDYPGGKCVGRLEPSEAW
jgi:hypothetical protein